MFRIVKRAYANECNSRKILALCCYSGRKRLGRKRPHIGAIAESNSHTRHAGRQFSVGGVIVKKKELVTQIKIVQTKESMEAYSQRHFARMRASNIWDMQTDGRFLPFGEGEDFTNQLLFEELKAELPEVNEQLVTLICERLPVAAKVLSNRRAKKPSFKLNDEYDVQDLLHALVRAHIKFSVQEDPIGKLAGTKSSRADISIEDIGVLIEVKFVRSPDDQAAFLRQFSEDLMLYSKWAPLKTLLYVIYNSGDLRDREALLKLDGRKDINGKVFVTKIVLI